MPFFGFDSLKQFLTFYYGDKSRYEMKERYFTPVSMIVLTIAWSAPSLMTKWCLCGVVKNILSPVVCCVERLKITTRGFTQKTGFFTRCGVLVKGVGKFERISWQEALDAIEKNFRDVIEQHGAGPFCHTVILGIRVC